MEWSQNGATRFHLQAIIDLTRVMLSRMLSGVVVWSRVTMCTKYLGKVVCTIARVDWCKLRVKIQFYL